MEGLHSVKGKKIVSFKIKVRMGRDANGKQIFKCATWYPLADLTPAKARKEVQKVAAVWKEETKESYLNELEARAVAGGSPPLPLLSASSMHSSMSAATEPPS